MIQEPEQIKDKKAYKRHFEKRRNRINNLHEICQKIIHPNRTVTLEIGCGHGDFLVGYAATKPDSLCIGLDMISKRIRKSDRKKSRLSLGNVHFLKAEVIEFFEALPNNVCLDRIFLLFPDPWPKKKHHKKRLIQHPFLDLLGELSLPGAELYFRTDHFDYYEWTKTMLTENATWDIAPDKQWPFETETYFQKLLKEYQSLIAVNRKPVVAG